MCHANLVHHPDKQIISVQKAAICHLNRGIVNQQPTECYSLWNDNLSLHFLVVALRRLEGCVMATSPQILPHFLLLLISARFMATQILFIAPLHQMYKCSDLMHHNMNTNINWGVYEYTQACYNFSVRYR
jgi:hypothetical protein